MQKKIQRLLESKIQIPDNHKDFQRREALLEELLNAEEKLLVLHATIGYGKTVLMSQYAEFSGHLCAWYHLDPLDNEVPTFMQYLIFSLQRALGSFVFDTDSYFVTEESRNVSMIRDLLLELAEYLSGIQEKKLILVLDDFQVLENQEIFELLEEFLEHSSDRLQLMIATKSAVPDCFTKYFLQNRGRILDFEQLSFRKQEVAQVLTRLISKEKSDMYAEMIWENMEGWPAGVMFAVLYLRQMGKIRLQVVDWIHISQESLAQNYIAYELFKSLPFDIQNFLIQTSFADELHAELCNEICGITNAGAILKYLLQENMFLLHVGGKSDSYRYHSMFRSFLNNKVDESVKKEVCGKIAAYYLRKGEMSVAAHYAILAEEAKLLLLIVEKAGIPLFREGKRRQVEEYLQMLKDWNVKPTGKIWYLEAVSAYWNGSKDIGKQALFYACQEDSVYVGYQKLYDGLESYSNEPQKGLALIEEGCRFLRGKNQSLPPLPEEERQLAEKIWIQEQSALKEKRQKLLRISCFGKFKVTLTKSGKEIFWRTRKAMELFAYLADLEGKPVERRVLLEHLWPENSPNNAVAMLHNMIYSIRKELSVQPGLEELIQYKERKYSMNLSLAACDLEQIKRFCILAEQGRTEELYEKKEELLHYWGTYLEEIDGSWCVVRRAYFERSYGKVCKILAEYCRSKEDFETEAAFWSAYIEVDRYCDEAVAGLLTCYGKLGERSQLKKVYESTKKLFMEELGLEPGPEIEQAYRQGIGKMR